MLSSIKIQNINLFSMRQKFCQDSCREQEKTILKVLTTLYKKSQKLAENLNP
jgi:hypothetical protein